MVSDPQVLIICFTNVDAHSAAIEAVIFITQGIWLLRTRKIRQRAKEVNLRWEDFPEAQAWEDKRLKIPGSWTYCWPRRRQVDTDEEIGKDAIVMD